MPINSHEVYLNYLDQIEKYLLDHRQNLGNSCLALDVAITKVIELKELPKELNECYLNIY